MGSNGGPAASQTISFTFTDVATGTAVTPTSGQITVTDISSQIRDATGAWRYYQDQLTFNESATVGGQSTGAPALNATTGTTFYTADTHKPSVSDEWNHTFSFEAFPSTMIYTSRGGYYGNQFIGLTGMEFTASC